MSDTHEIDLENFLSGEVSLQNNETMGVPSLTRPHIMIMLHGIRTYADWMDEFISEGLLSGIIIPIPVSYGNISTAKFLFGNIDISTYRSVFKQIKDIVNDHPNHDISVFCHSFGSKIFSEISDLLDYQFRYIIFAGSVALPYHSEITAKCSEKIRFRNDISSHRSIIINDCSYVDIWPRIASLIRGNRYSSAGSHGFHANRAMDRKFLYTHSQYMSKDHFHEYLVPLISNKECFYPIGGTSISSIIQMFKFFYNKLFQRLRRSKPARSSISI
ncbi:MAG: hypothetical protein Q7T93_09100 [Methylobacterium sp.]|uniref:hypothetical protein n=1 Tax=Methylobacterium sp. TaxID=409 RepID=UPI00271665FF|nr:hypothetical protein [Methylobacterium sp.]MDO9426982.1 hypothetical protein [Methylobacterium sp.]